MAAPMTGKQVPTVPSAHQVPTSGTAGLRQGVSPCSGNTYRSWRRNASTDGLAPSLTNHKSAAEKQLAGYPASSPSCSTFTRRDPGCSSHLLRRLKGLQVQTYRHVQTYCCLLDNTAVLAVCSMDPATLTKLHSCCKCMLC